MLNCSAIIQASIEAPGWMIKDSQYSREGTGSQSPLSLKQIFHFYADLYGREELRLDVPDITMKLSELVVVPQVTIFSDTTQGTDTIRFVDGVTGKPCCPGAPDGLQQALDFVHKLTQLESFQIFLRQNRRNYFISSKMVNYHCPAFC